jgi:hypothetical protein
MMGRHDPVVGAALGKGGALPVVSDVGNIVCRPSAERAPNLAEGGRAP